MEPDEVITSALAQMLKSPDRDFTKAPLTQFEIHNLMQDIFESVNDEETSEETAQFLLSCFAYLRSKIIIQ